MTKIAAISRIGLCLLIAILTVVLLGASAPVAPASAATSFTLVRQGPCTGWGDVILSGSAYAPGIPGAPAVHGNLHDGSCANAYIGGTDSYGLEYQCTEFAVHWAASVLGVAPSAWKSDGGFVDAEQMFSQAQHIPGLTAIDNGAGAPHPGDLIVFSDASVGHVAVVAGVTGNSLYFVGQNQSEAEQAITISNGDYVSPATASSWLGQTGTVKGWIHSNSAIGSSNGFEGAFQANTGNLYTYSSASGPANTQQGMMAGTSPSITAVSGGYEEAFQANTGNLILFGAAGDINTGQGMMKGTSPSIAATSNGFEVAFQANTGNLYTYSSASGPANTQQGMMAGTSPSIAA
jgi:hypothetical protein